MTDVDPLDTTPWRSIGLEPEGNFRSKMTWLCSVCPDEPGTLAERVVSNEAVAKGGVLGEKTCTVCGTRGELIYP